MVKIMKPIELLAEKLVGMKIEHNNAFNRVVTLEVESVKIEEHHRQITEDTAANDFYGDSYSWEEIRITFIDGSSIEILLSDELKIIQEYKTRSTFINA